MSTKRNKLSLKTKSKQKNAKPPQNTILSMFKSQRLASNTRRNEPEADSGATKCIVVSESSNEEDSADADRVDDILSTTVKAAHSEKGCHAGNRTSAAEQEPGSCSKGAFKKPAVNSLKCVTACDSDSDLDDFTSVEIKKRRRISAVADKAAHSGGVPQNVRPQGKYSLRKRKTVPYVEEHSDSAESESDITKKPRASASDDDVIVVGESQSKYFSPMNKADIAGSRVKRLSLKKSRTTSDIDTVKHADWSSAKPMHLSKDNCKGSCGDSEKLEGNSDKEHLPSTSEAYDVNLDSATASDKKLDSTEKQEISESPSKKLRNNCNFLEQMRQSIEQKQSAKHAESKPKRVTKRRPAKTAVEKESVKKSNNVKQLSVARGLSEIKGNSDKKMVTEKAKLNKADSNASSEQAADDDDNDVEDDDLDKDDEDSGDYSGKFEYRVPYYLENFKTVLTSVLDDKEYLKLFDEMDMKHIDTFHALPEAEQKLYVRLFSRKLAWLSVSKLSYPEISDNIPDLVNTLTAADLVQSGDCLQDLTEVLKILSAPDLKSLAKSYHINSQGLTKAKIIEALLKKATQNSISTMFKGGPSGSMEKTILNRARTYLGQVCRLNVESRAVFIRAMMLFSLYHTSFDEESGGGQNQLFQMLMVNIGRVTYPSSTVNRKTPVFADRAAVVRFETALQFEVDIQNLTERHKWAAALEVYKQAKAVANNVCCNETFCKWDRNLPEFLRVYTAGSVYTRICNEGVEILQKQKQYAAAVALLEELLRQDLYCENYRGHWYERLALNLEAHLKQPTKSLEVIKRSQLDERVRVGRRYALYERARKLCEAPKSKFADRMAEFKHEPVVAPPEVHIEGMVISDASSIGMKYQFVMQGNTDMVTLCAVEELVLEHYKQNGFPEGLHAEGSVISNLFVLLMWEVMFMDVPDAFHGHFQSCPLDIMSQDFYKNRTAAVEDRLAWIRGASKQELMETVEATWKEHQGKMCIGINWDKFAGPETHQHLVSCMGGQVIAGTLERFVKDPRHTRSGFPDLTLWNYDTNSLKICEVKGPGDRLSYKQILWIDYLLKLGVDAEVCYVKAVGSKKLRPQNSSK